MSGELVPLPRLPSARNERVVVGLVLVGIVALFLGDLLLGADDRAYAVLFLFAAWGPLLVVHELGHALAAWSVGWGVSEIVIGHGRELARFRIGSTRVRFKPVPVEGYVVPDPRGARFGRWKSAWVYLGGPLAELLVLGGLVLWSDGRLFQQSSELPVLAMQGTAVAIAIGVFYNLLPLPRAGHANDGLGIVLSFLQTPADLEARQLASVLTDVRRRLWADDPDGAREALARQPGLARDPRVVAWTGVCAAARGESKAADEVMRALGDPRQHGPRVAPELHAAKAWAWLLSGDRELLSFARGEAKHARNGAPAELHHAMLLGRIELERGDCRAAYALMMDAYRQAREVDEEGPCLAYLAMSAHLAGPSEAGDPPPFIGRDHAERFAAALAKVPLAPSLRARVAKVLGSRFSGG